MSLDKLCKGMPTEFNVLLKYSYSLDFKDMPDYDFFIDSFKRLRERVRYSKSVDNNHASNFTISTKETFLFDDYSLMNKTEETNLPEIKNKSILLVN